MDIEWNTVSCISYRRAFGLRKKSLAKYIAASLASSETVMNATFVIE